MKTTHVLAEAAGAFALSLPSVMVVAAALAYRFADATLCGVIALIGVVAAFIIFHVKAGRWDAFILTQAKYGHGITNPLKSFRRIWSALTRTGFGTEHKYVLELQSLLMHLITPAILVAFLARIRTANPIETLAAVYVAAFGGFALLMGPGVSLVRVEASPLPRVLLTTRLPPVVNALILSVFAFLKFEVAAAFFKNIAI